MLIFLYSLCGFLLTTVGALGSLVELISNVQLDIDGRDQWRKRRLLGAGALLGAGGVLAIGSTQTAFAREFQGVTAPALVIFGLLALAPMAKPTNIRVMLVVCVGVVAVLLAGSVLLGKYVSSSDEEMFFLHVGATAWSRAGFASGILLSSLCLYALAANVQRSRITYRPIAMAVAVDKKR